MGHSSAYLTPPYLSPAGRPRELVTPAVAPPTVRPRSSGESRWHPYESRARSLTPTSGLRSSRSTESVLSSSKSWPQLASKSLYPYPAYEAASYAHQRTPPSDRPSIGSRLYITPDPSPHPVRYSRKESYRVPPTLDREHASFNSFRPALPPTPPRTRSRASVEFDGVAPIPPCSIDSPHARRLFVQQLYDTLMSIYYYPSSLTSAQKVFLPVPGSLPVDPATLHWFTTELVRRASVSGGVLKLAVSYMDRARLAARRACEAQVPTPISPPPSPLYPVTPCLGIDAERRSRSPSAATSGRRAELADPRQMLLGALVLAQKFLIDAAYTSATWGKLSGLPASDVGAVERALGSALDWRLWEKNL